MTINYIVLAKRMTIHYAVLAKTMNLNVTVLAKRINVNYTVLVGANERPYRLYCFTQNNEYKNDTVLARNPVAFFIQSNGSFFPNTHS